nr:hypothetical protein GCM10020185_12280 [Pseudomonas brassicacearum subsp. brassicacearum]
MRRNIGGENTNNPVPNSLIHSDGVNRPTNFQANQACRMKQASNHRPKYWNVSGSQELKGLNRNASSGLESEK